MSQELRVRAQRLRGTRDEGRGTIKSAISLSSIVHRPSSLPVRQAGIVPACPAGRHRPSFFTVYLLFAIYCLLRFADTATAQEWKEIKGEHFIVYSTGNDRFSKDVLWNAEKYYSRIADDLGYPRYSEFWQWENRVKIYIYQDQVSYVNSHNFPQWSYGMAIYNKKEICTYMGSADFIGAILPHEITHLMFRDFVGLGWNIPLWLDEGVAQRQEPKKRNIITKAIKQIYSKNEIIPLENFFKVDIRNEKDEKIVRSYYIQAMSIIDFLIRKYGSDNFIHFCRNLRDGKNIEEALAFAYPTSIRSLSDLEERWRKYIKQI